MCREVEAEIFRNIIKEHRRLKETIISSICPAIKRGEGRGMNLRGGIVVAEY